MMTNVKVKGPEMPESLQAIISDKPRFLFFWPLPIFLAVILILLFVCSFIQYPDIIQQRVTLKTKDSSPQIAGKQNYAIKPGTPVYYAEIYLSAVSAEKVSINQPVQLRLYTYSGEDSGYIAGEIQSISGKSNASGTLILVSLPHGLTLNTGRAIAFNDTQNLRAVITTKNVSLLKRLFTKSFRFMNG